MIYPCASSSQARPPVAVNIPSTQPEQREDVVIVTLTKAQYEELQAALEDYRSARAAVNGSSNEDGEAGVESEDPGRWQNVADEEATVAQIVDSIF